MVLNNPRKGGSSATRFVGAHRVDENDLDYLLERRSDDIAELRTSLRLRILQTFLSAERPDVPARNEREARRKIDRPKPSNTGQEHFILGVGDHIEDLAQWVVKHRTFFRLYGVRDLPSDFSLVMSEKAREAFLLKVHVALVARELVLWRDNAALWCVMNNTGQMEWGFQPSLIDEAHILKKERPQQWRDNRNWHGRPENQGRRRAKELHVAPATSIGAVS